MTNKLLTIVVILFLLPGYLFAQQMAVNSTTIDLGQVEYQSPITATFDIKNIGDKPLHIYKVDTSCNCTVATYTADAVLPDDMCTLSVTYDAQLLGHFHKPIDIYSNASDEPATLFIKGIVVAEVDNYLDKYPFTLGCLAADCNTIDFDDVYQGETITQRFHIYNPTSATVTPQMLHLPECLSSTITPETITPNHSGTVSITLDSNLLRDIGREAIYTYLAANLGEKVSADKQLPIAVTMLPNITELSDEEQQMAPHLTLSDNSISLPQSSKKKATIEIQNTGLSPLTIHDIDIIGEGITLSLSRTLLDPAETAKLKVTTDPKRLRTTTIPPRVILITNDPQQTKVYIPINLY